MEKGKGVGMGMGMGWGGSGKSVYCSFLNSTLVSQELPAPTTNSTASTRCRHAITDCDGLKWGLEDEMEGEGDRTYRPRPSRSD